MQQGLLSRPLQRRRMALVVMTGAPDTEGVVDATVAAGASDVPIASDGGGQGTSIEKPQFGGGSGGTATLESDSDFSVNTILKQLESIQQGTPKNIVILGTRHCSFLHQQIIELLSYALVLSDNHIYTSGAAGTHAAAIRGALRAENPELLTVILPQTLTRQPREIRELLGQVRSCLFRVCWPTVVCRRLHRCTRALAHLTSNPPRLCRFRRWLSSGTTSCRSTRRLASATRSCSPRVISSLSSHSTTLRRCVRPSRRPRQ
jgi:hypothetical protein